MLFRSSTRSKSSPLYLLYLPVHEYTVPESWYRRSGDYRIIDAPVPVQASGMFVVPQKFKIRQQLEGDRLSRPMDIFPLRMAHLGDLLWLREHTVLVIPPSTQEKLFKVDAPNYKLLGVDTSRNIVPSRLLMDADEIWSHYIRKFSSVRESQTEETRIVDFRVRLALTHF